MMISTKIKRLMDIYPTSKEFVDVFSLNINTSINNFTSSYNAYDFSKHILNLDDLLTYIYNYYFKQILRDEYPDNWDSWQYDFYLLFIENIPAFYNTSKLLTERFDDLVHKEMGNKNISGINTTDYTTTTDDNFGIVSKNTNKDDFRILDNFLKYSYPLNILPFITKFNPLFIYTYLDIYSLINGGNS